jgi:hypothetical protein
MPPTISLTSRSDTSRPFLGRRDSEAGEEVLDRIERSENYIRQLDPEGYCLKTDTSLATYIKINFYIVTRSYL